MAPQGPLAPRLPYANSTRLPLPANSFQIDTTHLMRTNHLALLLRGSRGIPQRLIARSAIRLPWTSETPSLSRLLRAPNFASAQPRVVRSSLFPGPIAFSLLFALSTAVHRSEAPGSGGHHLQGCHEVDVLAS